MSSLTPAIASPYWLLAPLGLVLLVLLTPQSLELPGEWSRAISTNLREFLSSGVNLASRRHRLSPVILLWIIMAAGLASISLGQMDVPALRNLHARVVIIDLGISTNGRRQVDRARQFLDRTDAVPTAVVAVTSHAFVVVPFTTDFRHIDRYLEVLDPEVMPIDGRAPGLGLDKSLALLRDNDIMAGQIIVFADEMPPVDAFEVEELDLDPIPIWFVIDEVQHDNWRRYASQLSARIVKPADVDNVNDDLKQRRQRAMAGSASIRQRRDLTPWFIGFAMLLWLFIFFRREES